MSGEPAVTIDPKDRLKRILSARAQWLLDSPAPVVESPQSALKQAMQSFEQFVGADPKNMRAMLDAIDGKTDELPAGWIPDRGQAMQERNLRLAKRARLDSPWQASAFDVLNALGGYAYGAVQEGFDIGVGAINLFGAGLNTPDVKATLRSAVQNVVPWGSGESIEEASAYIQAMQGTENIETTILRGGTEMLGRIRTMVGGGAVTAAGKAGKVGKLIGWGSKGLSSPFRVGQAAGSGVAKGLTGKVGKLIGWGSMGEAAAASRAGRFVTGVAGTAGGFGVLGGVSQRPGEQRGFNLERLEGAGYGALQGVAMGTLNELGKMAYRAILQKGWNQLSPAERTNVNAITDWAKANKMYPVRGQTQESFARQAFDAWFDARMPGGKALPKRLFAASAAQGLIEGPGFSAIDPQFHKDLWSVSPWGDKADPEAWERMLVSIASNTWATMAMHVPLADIPTMQRRGIVPRQGRLEWSDQAISGVDVPSAVVEKSRRGGFKDVFPAGKPQKGDQRGPQVDTTGAEMRAPLQTPELKPWDPEKFIAKESGQPNEMPSGGFQAGVTPMDAPPQGPGVTGPRDTGTGTVMQPDATAQGVRLDPATGTVMEARRLQDFGWQAIPWDAPMNQHIDLGLPSLPRLPTRMPEPTVSQKPVTEPGNVITIPLTEAELAGRGFENAGPREGATRDLTGPQPEPDVWSTSPNAPVTGIDPSVTAEALRAAEVQVVGFPGTSYSMVIEGGMARPSQTLREATGMPEQLPVDQAAAVVEYSSLLNAMVAKQKLPGTEISASGVYATPDGVMRTIVGGEVLESPLSPEPIWKPAKDVPARQPDQILPPQQQVVVLLTQALNERTDLPQSAKEMLSQVISTLETVSATKDIAVAETLGSARAVLEPLMTGTPEQAGAAVQALAEMLTTKAPERALRDMVEPQQEPQQEPQPAPQPQPQQPAGDVGDWSIVSREGGKVTLKHKTDRKYRVMTEDAFAKEFPGAVAKRDRESERGSFSWEPLVEPVQRIRTDTPEFKAFFRQSEIVDPQGQPLVVYHGSKDVFTEFEARRSKDGLLFFSPNPEMAASWPGNRGREFEHGKPVKGHEEAAYANLRAEENRLLEEVAQSINMSVDELVQSKTPEAQKAREDYWAKRAELRKEMGDPSDVDRSVYPVYLSVQKLFDPRTMYQEIEPFLRTLPGMEGVIEQGRHKVGDWLVYERKEIVDELKRLGYDAMLLTESMLEPKHETIAVFSPTQVKSVNNRGTWDPRTKDMGGFVAAEPLRMIGDMFLTGAENAKEASQKLARWGAPDQAQALTRMAGPAAEPFRKTAMDVMASSRLIGGEAKAELRKGYNEYFGTSEGRDRLNELVDVTTPEGITYQTVNYAAGAGGRVQGRNAAEQAAFDSIDKFLLKLSHGFADEGGFITQRNWDTGKESVVPATRKDRSVFPYVPSSDPKKGFFAMLGDPEALRAFAENQALLNQHLWSKDKKLTDAEKQARVAEQIRKDLTPDEKNTSEDIERKAQFEIGRVIFHMPAKFTHNGKTWELLEPSVARAIHKLETRQAARVAMAKSDFGQDLPEGVREAYRERIAAGEQFAPETLRQLAKPGISGALKALREKVVDTAEGDIMGFARDLAERIQGKEPIRTRSGARIINEILSIPRALWTFKAAIQDVGSAVVEPFVAGGFKGLIRSIVDLHQKGYDQARTEAEDAGAVLHEMGNLNEGISQGVMMTAAEVISKPSNLAEKIKTVLFHNSSESMLKIARDGNAYAKAGMDQTMQMMGFTAAERAELIYGNPSKDLVHKYRVNMTRWMTSRGRDAEGSAAAANPWVKALVNFTRYATKYADKLSKEVAMVAKVTRPGHTNAEILAAWARLGRRTTGLVFGGLFAQLLYSLWNDMWSGDFGGQSFVRDWNQGPGTMMGKAFASQLAAGPYAMVGRALWEQDYSAALGATGPGAGIAATIKMISGFLRKENPIEVMWRFGEQMGIPRELGKLANTISYIMTGTTRMEYADRERSRYLRAAGEKPVIADSPHPYNWYATMRAVRKAWMAHKPEDGDVMKKLRPMLDEALEMAPGDSVAAKLRSMTFMGNIPDRLRAGFAERVGPDLMKDINDHDRILLDLAREESRKPGTPLTPWSEALKNASTLASTGGNNVWGNLIEQAVAAIADERRYSVPLAVDVDELVGRMAQHQIALQRENALRRDDDKRMFARRDIDQGSLAGYLKKRLYELGREKVRSDIEYEKNKLKEQQRNQR